MLNRLQLFRNVGQFDNVSTGAGIPLARLTLGYAENGRGKTTLAAILRSLASGDALPISERQRLGAAAQPHVIIDATGGPPPETFSNGTWNRNVSDIVIFDDTFVDQNICSGLVVESEHRQKLHELILGAQGVALNRALQQHIASVADHTRSLRELDQAIPEIARFGIPVDDYCALPENPDVENAIFEAERALAAAKEQDGIRRTMEFEPIGLPAIHLAGLQALMSRDLPNLDRSAAEQVQRHIAKLGRGGENWIAEGVDMVPDRAAQPEGKPCPFCAQDLGGSALVQHYRSYFGATYGALKQDIAHARDQFNTVGVVNRGEGLVPAPSLHRH